MKRDAQLEALAAELLEKLRQSRRQDSPASAEETSDEGFTGAAETEESFMRSLRTSGGGERADNALLRWQPEDGALSEAAERGSAESAPLRRRQGRRRAGEARLARYAGGPEGYAAAETGYDVPAPALRTEPGSLRLTAESLSEAFCRDARRYDGGFEKY